MQDRNVLASKLKSSKLSLRIQENYENWCQQMSYFKTEMHKIRFRLTLCPIDPAEGAYSAAPDIVAGAYF